jgi:beta-lactamase class D
MKNHILFVIACALIACNGKEKIENQTSKTTDNFVLNQEFQQLFDSEKLNGAVLVYDLQKDTFYSNNFEWCMKGHLPASTFKIANSIIALETGVVENDSTLFKWDGQKRAINNWEQDLILKDAFHFSCVPCYQEVARNIGTERMIEYLDKLGYGDMKVDSSNIDYFWLEGKSQIFQFQQVDFLKRFYLSKLPISGRTEKIMKRMMVIEENENYKLTGKNWLVG